jgi:hypothetical protein
VLARKPAFWVVPNKRALARYDSSSW